MATNISEVLPEEQNLGALSLLGDSLDSGTSGQETIDLFQLQSQTPDLVETEKLQDVYGTSSMPVFEWVRSIQTGERTYNPADQFDQQRAEEYRQLRQTNPELPELPGIGDLAKAAAPGLGGMIAEGIAKAALDPLVGNTAGDVLSAYGKSVLPDFLGGTSLPSDVVSSATSDFISGFSSNPVQQIGSNVFVPELANASAAAASGNSALFSAINQPNAGIAGAQIGGMQTYNATGLKSALNAPTNLSSNVAFDAASGNIVSGSGQAVTSSNIVSAADGTGYLSGAGDTLSSGSVWASAGIGAIVNFGIGVAMGQDPVKAAKSAGASAIGGVLGTAVGGPIGGFIGSAIGGMIGGRVICNELQRQGLMTRKQIVLDYRFTRDYLTPAHVDGYHYWAIHVVRQLRQGKNVKLWKHIATHRVNEIAYIYGERDKPDYLGKVYRHIGEPICWLIGKLKNEESDWSVLYQKKEI